MNNVVSIRPATLLLRTLPANHFRLSSKFPCYKPTHAPRQTCVHCDENMYAKIYKCMQHKLAQLCGGIQRQWYASELSTIL